MPRSLVCGAHIHNSLVPVERHHIWPLGYHGPNTADNIVQVCCNAHSDVHYLLERMLRTGDAVPWTELRTYGPAVGALARAGYERVTAYATSLAA